MSKRPECPEHSNFHQPAYSPWWSGDSLYADDYALVLERKEKYYHHTDKVFQPGDLLLPPADLKTLPDKKFIGLAEDGCINYSSYDVHGVYVSTHQWFKTDGDYGEYMQYAYEVEPLGRIWIDPEQRYKFPISKEMIEAHHRNARHWCTDSARVIRKVSVFVG